MENEYKLSADRIDIQQTNDFEATSPVLAGIAFENNFINETFSGEIIVSSSFGFSATQTLSYYLQLPELNLSPKVLFS